MAIDIKTRPPLTAENDRQKDVFEKGSSSMKKSICIAILCMGFSGLVAQMLLLRELLVVFSGNEIAIGIILANWLILEAFGCFFLGKMAENTKNIIALFAGITILFSLTTPGAIYLVRILKSLIGISIGESVAFLPMLYSSFLILLPVSVTHGALFTFSCKIYSIYSGRDASAIGKVYVYETFGMIVGGIIWTYFLIPYFHAFQMAVGLAILNFIVLFFLLAHHWKLRMQDKSITIIIGSLMIFSCYLLFTNGAEKLHQLSLNTQWKDHNILHYENSNYGNTCVVQSGEQYIFFSDGIPSLITPIPDIAFVEKFVHLPLLTHPNPKRLLILSGGAGGVINEILKHPTVESIDYAELDPLYIDLIKRFHTPLTENELNHQNVNIQHIDGRLFLKMTQNKYDLIQVGLLNPSDLQTNRFFTIEFFSLAKQKLNENGILVIGLPGSFSFLNDELKNLNGCLYNTLKRVFPYVRVFPGDSTNFLLSSNSNESILIDGTQLFNRLRERDIEVNVFIPRHIKKMLHPGWQDWVVGFLEESTRKINQDFKPLGMFYSLSHWNTLYAPYLNGLFRWVEMINLQVFFILFVIFIILFSLARFRKENLFGSGIPFCIATTGFAGMIFDLALIFTFQSIYGYVFSWIGLLVTSFMAGSATGAMIITSRLPQIKNYLKLCIATDLSIICFSLGMPFVFLILHPYLSSPGGFMLMKALFLSISFGGGFLLGAQFPIANKLYLNDDAKLSDTAGILYSSDLLGGWFGGVVGGVVLLPVLGLLGSCVIVALLKLCSFIILTGHARTTA